MPEEEVDVFKHFQYWLYSKTILMTDQSENDIDWRILIDLFILDEAHGIPDLQNAAIDGLIDKQATEENTPLEQISYIYGNTTDGSPLRQLFVGFTRTHAVFYPEAGPDSWFSAEQYETCTKRFYFDLSVALCQTTLGLHNKVVNFKTVHSNYYVPVSD